MENIHPIFDQILGRQDKEKLLNQKGLLIWLTGLSGSGKSTIAKGLESQLYQNGFFTKLLDGDNIRTGLCNNLTFSEEDRQENIRRIAEVSRLFLDCGVITIASFISPKKALREMAGNITGPEDFFEVFVDCPLEVCEQRDVKGLYKKAREGEIPDFTGIHSEFEAPDDPSLTISTDKLSLEDSVKTLYESVYPKITVQK